MYGNGNPFVPVTGFGAPAGAAILAGYPIVACGITILGAFVTATLLWKRRTNKQRAL